MSKINLVGQKIKSGSLLQGNNEINVKRLSDGVYFLNFFIENINTGTFIKFEVSAKSAYCTSSNGGNYFYLYNRRGSDWFSSNRALAIDVLIEGKLPI